MAVMESTHGWHQRGRGFSNAQTVEGAAQCGDGADDHGASRHLDSVSWTFLGGDSKGREQAAVPVRWVGRPYQAAGVAAKVADESSNLIG
jgi:hypothetical protein